MLTVSQVNELVAGMLDQYFSDVWIEGEISNFKRYPSGHLYFALKDAGSQIQAICFKHSAARLRFEPEDGMLVVGHGRLEVYAPTGKYQVVLDWMEPKGLGALQKAFEQLKRKLEKEGLFAAERKRPVPALPRVLGIVTSEAGAAIHDMLKTLRLHRAHLKVLLCPAQVQGEGAAEQVAQGIAALNSVPEVEVVIVARGGGSIEDLWCFNEELVARAIAASRVPVVTGIGHETDFTIADFVADVRAATPTAAAQLVSKGWEELQQRLAEDAGALLERFQDYLLASEQRLEELTEDRAFDRVKQRLTEAGHVLERLAGQVERLVAQRVRRATELLAGLERSLSRQNPEARLVRQGALLQALAGRAEKAMREAQRRGFDRLRISAERIDRPVRADMERRSRVLGQAGAKLDTLSPLASLGRGYAICLKGKVVVSRVEQVRAGDRLSVRVSDGSIDCRAQEKAGPAQPDLFAQG